MNRTRLLFALAGALGFAALLLGLKQPPPGATHPPSRPPPGPFVATSTGGPLSLRAALSDPFLVAGGMREVFVKVDIDAIKLEQTRRAPVNLALVLDRSGSMAGSKIDHARRAARHLVGQLDESDRFALVTFGTEVSTLVESMRATPEAKARFYAAIDGISEMGGTNISGGVEAGLAEIVSSKSSYSVSRIVLLSDGQANEGVISPEGLAALARRVSTHGVTLSAIGVGLDFNEHVMEAMAEYGGGGYHFLSDTEQLAGLFARELQQATASVAASPQLRLQPAGGAVIQEVFGYLSEPDGAGVRVRLPDFAGGEHRKVVVRMAVPASMPGALAIADVSLTYADLTRDRAPASAAAAVSATVTADTSLASRERNLEVAQDAAQASALKEMREAGQQYAEGRRDEAEKTIQRARGSLRKAMGTLGSSASMRQAEAEAGAFEDAVLGNAAPSAPSKRIHSFSNSAR